MQFIAIIAFDGPDIPFTTSVTIFDSLVEAAEDVKKYKDTEHYVGHMIFCGSEIESGGSYS